MELFKNYIEHFCKFVKQTINKTVLLILYGHCSHTKSIDVLDCVSRNCVVMLAQPPHTTVVYELQTLDVGFSGHFKLIMTNVVGCAIIPDAHTHSPK